MPSYLCIAVFLSLQPVFIPFKSTLIFASGWSLFDSGVEVDHFARIWISKFICSYHQYWYYWVHSLDFTLEQSGCYYLTPKFGFLPPVNFSFLPCPFIFSFLLNREDKSECDIILSFTMGSFIYYLRAFYFLPLIRTRTWGEKC